MASTNTNSVKVIFECDKHDSFVSEKLQIWYDQGKLFDTVIKAGTTNCISIQAHRVVLCAWSEYFLETLRDGGLALKAINELELNEIEASTLKPVIDFMYSGSIEFSLEMVSGILRTAAFLKMKTLIDGCSKFIEKNINFNNSLSCFRLANELSLPKLKEKALECTYIHFVEISKEQELLMLNEHELKDLLFNDNPYGDFEEDVFLSMVAWINHDKTNREHLVFQLLSMVRFEALTAKFIVEQRKSVCKTVESYELICSWLQWHLSPDTRSKDQQICTLKARKMPATIAVARAIDLNIIHIEKFVPKTNAWSKAVRLTTKERDFSMIEIDGKLVLAQGNGGLKTVFCVNMQLLKMVDIPPMKNIRQCCQLVDLKGSLCVFGEDVNGVSNSMEIFNFSTRQWRDVQLMRKINKRSQIAAYDGMLHILVFAYGILYSYDISSNKWTLQTVGKDTLELYGLVAIDGFLYVIGGYRDGKIVNTCKRFNLSKKSWCKIASLPHDLSCIRTTVFENKIIIIDDFRRIIEYNPDTDTWNATDIKTPDNVCNIFSFFC